MARPRKNTTPAEEKKQAYIQEDRRRDGADREDDDAGFDDGGLDKVRDGDPAGSEPDDGVKKMNNIIMIPIGQLEHHPENPRKNIGDITELTESIRKNGIMQNLTVVRNRFVPDLYTVVIGNRRMEAAKAAGLAEVPCVISDMDPRTQTRRCWKRTCSGAT